MRSWIWIVLLTGCCADTYEIVADRTNQPAAQIVFRVAGVPDVTETGILYMSEAQGAFQAALHSQGSSSFVLHVSDTATGTFSGELDIHRAMQPVETVSVMITARNVQLIKVCMDADQNDYSTGRCGFTFLGTLELTGVTASNGDISATWVMNQVARVSPGTPDC
jgi:hypothetical protein